MKPNEGTGDSPWTTQIRTERQRTYKDAAGHTRQSPINIVNEQGDWRTWRPTLSSQVLSKQSPELAARQLDLAYRMKQSDFDEIVSLTNPVVRRKLLQSFGDEADAAAVHLKAAAMPHQGSHVILPLEHMREDQIYAPNYRNGERVALIRHPHGGTFEIPVLTVNNRNPEGRTAIGTGKGGKFVDAVGIHPSVAKRLSGADFDGDAVLVIPQRSRLKLEVTPALEGLKNFDPQREYPKYPGMTVMTEKQKQAHMGNISNLITDMTIKAASTDEIARAVRHSMVVIDAPKHELDYKGSYDRNGIRELKEKYQGKSPVTGRLRGASTIISRAKSRYDVPERRPRPYGKGGAKGGPISRTTGEKMWEPTGRMVPDRRKGHEGELVPKLIRSKRLAEAKNAEGLISTEGTAIEHAYAFHSNRLKALANRARLASLNVEGFYRSPTAAKTYAPEVARLSSALRKAQMNAPRERQAQLVARSLMAVKIRDNPDWDDDTLRKQRAQTLKVARDRVGAHKDQIIISNKEWEAIQARAVSAHRLSEIIDHADLDRVKELATPRRESLMSSTKVSLARIMLSRDYTQAEVAEALGVSVSTLAKALDSEGG
jgi:hypothetical protein